MQGEHRSCRFPAGKRVLIAIALADYASAEHCDSTSSSMAMHLCWRRHFVLKDRAGEMCVKVRDQAGIRGWFDEHRGCTNSLKVGPEVG